MTGRVALSGRRSPHGRTAALLLVTFVAGLATRGIWPPVSSETRSTEPASSKSAAPTGPGPRSVDGGIPTGFSHDEVGALTAAASYVLTGQTLITLEPTRVADAFRTMAANGSADAQAASASEQLARLRAVLASGTGPTHYLQAVLATRLDAFAPERARVSVWSVGVLWRSNVAEPQAAWNTSTFELVWERNDWKVWSENITAGPVPDLNGSGRPATAAQLDQALAGFASWSALR